VADDNNLLFVMRAGDPNETLDFGNYGVSIYGQQFSGGLISMTFQMWIEARNYPNLFDGQEHLLVWEIIPGNSWTNPGVARSSMRLWIDGHQFDSAYIDSYMPNFSYADSSSQLFMSYGSIPVNASVPLGLNRNSWFPRPTNPLYHYNKTLLTAARGNWDPSGLVYIRNNPNELILNVDTASAQLSPYLDGLDHQVMFAITPKLSSSNFSSMVSLYVDGTLICSGNTPSGTFPNGQWCTDESPGSLGLSSGGSLINFSGTNWEDYHLSVTGKSLRIYTNGLDKNLQPAVYDYTSVITVEFQSELVTSGHTITPVIGGIPRSLLATNRLELFQDTTVFVKLFIGNQPRGDIVVQGDITTVYFALLQVQHSGANVRGFAFEPVCLSGKPNINDIKIELLYKDGSPVKLNGTNFNMLLDITHES